MKRFLVKVLMLLLFVTAPCFANTYVLDYDLNNADVAQDTNFTQNLALGKTVDYLSYQVIYSTKALAAISGSSVTISATNDTIVSTVAYVAGYALVYSTSSNFTSSNLVTGTTYYVVPRSTGLIRLATTRANATAGTYIDIGADGSSGTFALTPCVWSGTASIVWKASNDGLTWNNLSVSSDTFTASTVLSSRLIDFSMTTYKFIRCSFTAATFGVVNLRLRGYGKRND